MISGIVLTLSSLILDHAQSASPPVPVANLPAEATALIAQLKRDAPADTAYVEIRFVHMLKQPMQLHGELHYGGPDSLGKRVDAPYREDTTITAGQVQVQREGKPARHFSLERAPELQAMLASFSALLGGDAATLDRYYKIDVTFAAPNWRLTLTPRDAALARHLREILVDGQGDQTRCFHLHQADGDASVMLLGKLAEATLPTPPLPAAIETLCRNPTP